MADAIDWSAAYLRTHLGNTYKPHDIHDPEYPWEGLVICMFQELAARGFSMPTREVLS